jgi:hypothetical protein
MNVGVGMQTSARIYFEYSISIWSMLNMGESFLLIFGTFIHIEGLTVTYVIGQGDLFLRAADKLGSSPHYFP